MINIPSEEILSKLWMDGILTLGISIYLGIRGGKLTARHYLEEGYKVHTKDEALLTQAKKKWDLEI